MQGLRNKFNCGMPLLVLLYPKVESCLHSGANRFGPGDVLTAFEGRIACFLSVEGPSCCGYHGLHSEGMEVGAHPKRESIQCCVLS